MLTQIREFVVSTPGATNFQVAAAFGLTRGMADRLLEFIEDEGHIILDRPAEACGAAAGGSCGTSGPAATLNQMAEASRAKRGAVEVAAPAVSGWQV